MYYYKQFVIQIHKGDIHQVNYLKKLPIKK